MTEMSVYQPDASGKIYSLAIEISDLGSRVAEMHSVIADTSWLSPLDIIDQATYEARSKPTIDKVVNDILTNVESDISEEFGEYMVSDSAQTALHQHLAHIRAPLAELIKEKVSGNPGFDFHTVSPDSIVAFGEAKFSGVKNAHGRALEQINRFIDDEKDVQELSDLRKFFHESAVINAAKGKKSYSAAFSITSKNVQQVMDNALHSKFIPPLLEYEAVYLIGVKVSA
ncbi:hypothetical protein [Vibrio fluvialis]|uniref:hypothetical protein n=1 Tax=Vibrio fluvialis TaxID=676 RepID=UPI00193250D1|nr:hypothetical protein [Vibrio fluvialis]